MDDSEREVAERTKVETEWSQFIDRANAPIFGVDSEGLVNEKGNLFPSLIMRGNYR